MLLDVFRPASATEPLPLVVWVHGGGFVGTKDELADAGQLFLDRLLTFLRQRLATPPQ